MGVFHEFLYFDENYKGNGDFSGEESAFDGADRIEFLKSYSAFLQKRYGLQKGSEKAVAEEQTQETLARINYPIESRVRNTLRFEKMLAFARENHSGYRGWQLYTQRATIGDGCVILNDGFLQPVPCAKYDFSGEGLKSVLFKVYIAGDYEMKGSGTGSEKPPLDIQTGRIVELRDGLKELVKIQFYADGRAFALVGVPDPYHHQKIYLGRFTFGAWNEIEIRLKDGGYDVRVNDGGSRNLPFTEQGKPSTLFLSGGRHPVGLWKVKIEKFVYEEGERTEFFIKDEKTEASETPIGEVSLPYKLGGYENRDKLLVLKTTFTAKDAPRAILQADTLDPGGEIFVNGRRVCKTDGFMRQRVDIKKYLVAGENSLEIVVYPRAPEILYSWHKCRDNYNAWACGEVKLDFCASAHISSVRVATQKTRPAVRASVKVELDQAYRGRLRIFLRETYPAKGEEYEAFQGGIKGKTATVGLLPSVGLWSPEKPRLYAVRVQLETENGVPMDDFTVETGFRTIAQKNGSIYLNGEKIRLKGALIMQFLSPYNNIPLSHLCPTDEEIVRQFCGLKNMNANLARLHILGYGTNDGRFARFADRMGLLLIWTTRWIDSVETVQWTEKWERGDEYAAQVREVINSPSIIMWEGANELHAGRTLTDRLYDEFVTAVKKVDTTRLICPCSHLYYGGGLYGDEGFYYQDDGKRDQNFEEAESSFGWKDPLVVRSAHTYEIMLGYGGGWDIFRRQAWRSQPALFKSRKHAYIVSEIAVIGRHDDGTQECKEYVKSDSYELKDERLALGVELTQREWRLSQAYQALAAQHTVKSLWKNGADGIAWCCLSGGANDGSYFKPPIDFYGYAKYAFYLLKEGFSEAIAFNGDTAVKIGKEFGVKPTLSQLKKGETYDVTVRITDENGNVVDEREYRGVLAKRETITLPRWKPKLAQNGYYAIEYSVRQTNAEEGKE